jgi:glutaminyl-peptide cyclotransferase
MKKFLYLVALVIVFSLLQACKYFTDKTDTTAETTDIQSSVSDVPAFSQDTAFAFLAKQVAFGPRVPGTTAHKKCSAWMVSQFKAMGLNVIEQNFTAKVFDGKTLPAKNIIASYKPDAAKRIIIAAHWDARPFADKDPTNKVGPIDAANDGASGVAVIMEMARLITADSNKLAIGVDFILFDAEDWGAPNDYKKELAPEFTDYGGYCLGSDYWSKNLHKPNYTAYYGILLDMVGAKNATFRKEGVSMQVAPTIVANIWAVASQIGYGQYFINEDGGQLTDDHVPVIKNAKIPMVDIIDLKLDSNTFFKDHHTHGDNLDTIDKNSLKAVGQTLLHVLYNEPLNM